MSDDRPGAPRELHTILRVSNVGGPDIRFHKDDLVLVWDGTLMRYRPLDEKERSWLLAWLEDLRQLAQGRSPPKA